jgi:hypothetical protein
VPYVAITDAVPKIRTALYSALSPVGAAYWLQAPEGAALPFLVYQAQDGGGLDDPYLNSAGWSGLYTIRALAASPSAAETLLSGVPAAIAGLSVSGYSSRVRFMRSLVLPPENGTHTAALVYEVELFQ